MDNSQIFEILKNYMIKEGAIEIKLFGSYATGEQNINSDIDILVEFKNRKSLLDLVKIERKLSEEIGIKVDLITKKALSPYLKTIIDKEARVIYK